jgi:hypothetical protein
VGAGEVVVGGGVVGGGVVGGGVVVGGGIVTEGAPEGLTECVGVPEDVCVAGDVRAAEDVPAAGCLPAVDAPADADPPAAGDVPAAGFACVATTLGLLLEEPVPDGAVVAGVDELPVGVPASTRETIPTATSAMKKPPITMAATADSPKGPSRILTRMSISSYTVGRARQKNGLPLPRMRTEGLTIVHGQEPCPQTM